MRMSRSFLVVLISAFPVLGQTAAGDPAGHWDGAIHAPNLDVSVQIDLMKNAGGELAGAFSNPAQGIRSLPLSDVGAEGTGYTFAIRAAGGGGVFRVAVSADGKTMTGDFIPAQSGRRIPFTAIRTGEAQIAPAPTSAPIGRELEGTWNGSVDVNGKPVLLVLTMANHSDGTATGTIFSPDAGAELPIAITQKASSLSLTVPAISGSYAGVLSADGAELVGTWTQGVSDLPLTFKRGAAGKP